MNGYQILLKLLEKISLKEISEHLYVNQNTVKRWLLLKDVPKYYIIHLCDLDNTEIDYSNFTYIEKDQFFTQTSTAEYCLKVLKNKLQELKINSKNYVFIEPSSGDGSFFNLLPQDKRIGLDIEPRQQDVTKANFLKWLPPKDNSYITLGNPPFGLRGNLALRFVNHASQFSDIVAFILPPLFDSDGKGTCKSRVKNLNLIHSEKIETEFYYPDGNQIRINVIFQIWSKHHKIEEQIKPDYSNFVKIYSLSDGGTPSTTRNKIMHDKCDFYFASSSFEKEKMKFYSSFEELPNRRGYGLKILTYQKEIKEIVESIDWPQQSFLATNSSYNMRTSSILDALSPHLEKLKNHL